MVRAQGPGPGEILLEQKQVCSECNKRIPRYGGGAFSPEDILGEEEEDDDDILGEEEEDADAGSYDSDKMLLEALILIEQDAQYSI